MKNKVMTSRKFKDLLKRYEEIKRLRGLGIKPVAIARKLGIDYVTVWRYLREK